MPFTRPTNPLSQYTVQALRDLQAEATTAFDTLVASATQDTVTDEQLADMEAMRAFSTDVETEIASRADRSGRFGVLIAQPIVTPVVDESTVVAPETEAVVAAAPAARTVTVADVAAEMPAIDAAPVVIDEPVSYGSLVAAANVPNFVSGAPMTTVDMARVFIGKDAQYASLAQGGHQGVVTQQVAQMRRTYPDNLVIEGNNNDQDVLLAAANERNLPGGSLRASRARRRAELRDNLVTEGLSQEEADLSPSLVAAGGWCAPSETIYTTCFQTTADGMYDTPEVVARRGGIRHNSGLDWSTVYGGGNILASAAGVTGFFNLTEAQVAAGSPTKTNIQVACPSFVDTRLGVTGLWITSPILTNRGYPEFVATFMDGAMMVHQHQLNALRLQSVVAASTAVTLAADPYVADGTVTSNLLAAVEQAIVDLKYRLRLARNATLEVVLPFWVHAQFRADLSRRVGTDNASMSVTDSMIDAWFAMRGANVQYVYDWQDAFTSSTAGLPGAATAVQVLPAITQFLVYPTGTWVTALQDVITLSAVYDSTLLATNMVTQLFSEDGWAMLQMCPVSRVYTVPTCPSGSTTAATVGVDCNTP